MCINGACLSLLMSYIKDNQKVASIKLPSFLCRVPSHHGFNNDLRTASKVEKLGGKSWKKESVKDEIDNPSGRS